MARHASPVQSLLVDDRFDGDVYAHEPLSRHTTYRIGGPARFFVRANSVGALTGLVDVCAAEGTPWVVLGRGSNVLVADAGFAGVAIVLGRDFRTLRFDDDRFIVGAGASLSAVVQEAFKRAIGGFEFAVGTPGTVGGALRMNAGTADEWIGQRVVSVTTYRPGRGLARRRGDEISWGYRASSFAPDEVILECELAAEGADPYRVRDKMAAIVTNIEADHLDHYEGLEEIYAQFAAFLSGVREGGPIVVCGDDPKLVEVARGIGRTVTTYGFSEDCDARILATEAQGVGTRFTLRLPDGRVVASRIKQNPGLHNVSNGAAVLTLISLLGLDVDLAAEKLQEFAGVRRRFDLIGEAGGVTVVDDYAHHPTEIAATIKAAKALDFNRVHVLFQPHRYSRVALFTDIMRDEFGSAFDEADTVTFMDVYSAGEAPVPGVTGKTFLNVVTDHGHPHAVFVPRRIDTVPHMLEVAEPGDLVITMGAGDVTAIAPQLVDELGR